MADLAMLFEMLISRFKELACFTVVLGNLAHRWQLHAKAGEAS
jgi:hypothetical protein